MAIPKVNLSDTGWADDLHVLRAMAEIPKGQGCCVKGCENPAPTLVHIVAETTHSRESFNGGYGTASHICDAHKHLAR